MMPVHYRLLIIVAVGLLTACTQPVPTPTPDPSSTPSPLPTATATPTPTPTATPTAAPLVVADNLREVRAAVPVPQRGAPCGVVDLFDFPLGPPDGFGYSVRWVFGRYSGRYNGIHAGEDWVWLSGDSLGQPVYAIGHGTVTYAQPYGWGVDKGVVIVRHVFPNGNTILSFYGHLDPPSVVLQAGDCVARGDQVGAVGKPRGRPHLHFEVRNHTPDDPGPGYWSIDPRLAGWQPPSDYIWDYRIKTAPGVQWTRPFTATGSTGIGLLDDGTLAALDDGRVIGIDPADGSLRWTRPLSLTVNASVVDAGGSAFYLSSRRGLVEAYNTVGEPLWQMSFGEAGDLRLMPLPGGGVVVHRNDRMSGVSASGDLLWQIDRAEPPYAWALDGDQLIFTTEAAHPVVHTLDRSGTLLWAAHIGGRPIVAGDHVFIYNAAGIYRLNPEKIRADLVLPLDAGSLIPGDAIALLDGGVMIAHRGLLARRLIVLNADGTLRWDHALGSAMMQTPRLAADSDRVYVLMHDGDVLAVDNASGEARRIFDGGSATRLEGANWGVVTSDGRVVIDFRGGTLVEIDPAGTAQAAGGTTP